MVNFLFTSAWRIFRWSAPAGVSGDQQAVFESIGDLRAVSTARSFRQRLRLPMPPLMTAF
jgi:hypothetical protein